MSQLHEIEVSIEEVKEAIALAEALEKLERSSAFKKVIKKAFIEDQPGRMTALFASPDERQRQAASDVMTAIGKLEVFFNTIHMQGAHARGALEDLEAAKLEVIAEE
ncbi:hypothetical protein [Vibrio phage vB_VhaP_PG11]|nr:hypothetical protein [Vibrio phage vB_VhaP_PG11]